MTDETAEHIFVDCPSYQEWRTKAEQELKEKLEGLSRSGKWPERLQEIARRLPKDLINHSPSWPRNRSRFYMGHVPRITGQMDTHTDLKILKVIHQEAHYAELKLTGRIYGTMQGKERDYITGQRRDK
jgi:hypothetical protein